MLFNNGALKEKLNRKMENLEKSSRVGGSIGLGYSWRISREEMGTGSRYSVCLSPFPNQMRGCPAVRLTSGGLSWKKPGRDPAYETAWLDSTRDQPGGNGDWLAVPRVPVPISDPMVVNIQTPSPVLRSDPLSPHHVVERVVVGCLGLNPGSRQSAFSRVIAGEGGRQAGWGPLSSTLLII